MKGIVFPAGRRVPYVVDVSDEIELSDICEELGFDFAEIVRPRKRLPRGFVIICDEEGLLKPNELNHVASWFYETEKHGSPIVGNVMVLKEVFGDEGPELSGMTEEDVNKVFDAIGKE